MTATRTAAILLALAATGICETASAQDRSEAQPRVGVRAGDVLLRARAILVAPNERSGGIHPAFPGETVKVDNRVIPEIDR